MHHDLTPEQQALSEIIIHSKYARFLPEHRRREGWDEIIERNRSMHLRHYSARVEPDKWDGLAGEIEHAYRNFVAPKKVLPSMRSLQFAGRAMELSPVRGNNCAFLPVDDPAALREVMFLLLSGAGAGFSVQHHHTARLPAIRPPSKRYRYKVSDNIEGWADAVDVLMQAYFGRGEYLPEFDYRDVRAKGSYLVTSGGRAPGPEPLAQALRRIQALLDSKHPGAKLRPIDVHDILCHIGDAVYAGGIRRAAMISLFDAEDELMLAAKSSSAPARLVATLNPNPDADGKVAVRVFVEGAERDLRITEYDLARLQTDGVLGWWAFAPQRARANNSAVLVRNGHTREDFARVFAHTRDSGSGEPGFVWSSNTTFGVNPCCEVSLEPFGLCNLVEINASTITSQQDLNERAAAAALIATLQAGYTDFHYLRPIWRETAERAALIGVGATGIASGNFTRFDLAEAAEVVRTTNERVARVLGINPAHRMTTVKPAGCRPWYGLVTTDRGIQTLEELFRQHQDGTTWSEFRGGDRAVGNGNRIARTFDNGVAEVFEVELAGGIVLHSTAEHPWFVNQTYDRSVKARYIDRQEFVATTDLQPGDILDVRVGIYDRTEHTELVTIPTFSLRMRGNTHQIRQPVRMSPDLAWLFGYLWGDGSLSEMRYRLRFTDGHRPNLFKAQRVLREQFALDVKIHELPNKDAASLEVPSVQLWEYLAANGVRKYAGGGLDIIPACVRRSSQEDIIAFIAGFADADGCVHSRNEASEEGYKRLALAQAPGLFTRHLQEVALAVGLAFGHSLNTCGSSFQREKSIVLMNLSSFSKRVAVELLERHSVKASRFPEPFIHEDIANPNMILGRVKGVRSIGEMPTFDVEVESEPWFYAGAVRSHNSTSLVLGTSSGIHAWHAPYYIRRMRVNKGEALYEYLKQHHQAFIEDDIFDPGSVVFSVPQKAPAGAVTRGESALELLERVSDVYRRWIVPGHAQGANTNNVSCTVSVREDEWDEVEEWMWAHRREYTGLSLMPANGGSYQQAPFEDISEERYLEMVRDFAPVDTRGVVENEDMTDLVNEIACGGGACELTHA